MMMITTKFKELMSLNGEMNAAEIESRFTQIAKLLFENFAIQKGEKIYLFKEIEFYFYNKHHQKSIFLKRLSFTSTISIIVTLSLIPVSPILYTGT